MVRVGTRSGLPTKSLSGSEAREHVRDPRDGFQALQMPETLQDRLVPGRRAWPGPEVTWVACESSGIMTLLSTEALPRPVGSHMLLLWFSRDSQGVPGSASL